jgi:hemerythrin-like domain-containing protein
MTTETTPLHPYTREMAMIHRIFRRESRMMVDLVGNATVGDTARATAIAAAWQTYAGGLHQHHVGEDEYLWPKLARRIAPEALKAQRIQEMESQHEQLSASLQDVSLHMERWAQQGEVEARDELMAAILSHREVLCAHLDEEESAVMPLVAEHITEAEWKELGERSLAATPKSQLLIALGAILEDATPEERRDFLGRLPLPARLAWHLIGRRQYATTMGRLRNG